VGYNRGVLLLGTGIRLAVIVALTAALMAIPLLTVHRARCREHGKRVTRWYWVAPGKDAKRRGCVREQDGLSVLLDQVGIKT
jgi:hypothetical protein